MLIGIYTLTSILLLFVKSSKCSLVIDAMSQAGLHIAEYCPKTKYCEEGAHVMCMYYDPNRVMGPECSNPQNVSMTPDFANKFLDVVNAVRSRIALGKEKGKDGPLPRGYGIYRLSWDEELATFAQVLANRCIQRRDLCRATKKFPDPDQVTGLVRFSYPGWLSATENSTFTTPGLTLEKINYAITQTLKSWYNQKNYVTADMIMNYPNWLLNPSSKSRVYFAMISGSATHMGCGISAFSQFVHQNNNAPLNYNIILIVCNYSAKPATGGQVYTTTHPDQVGYTIKCGCPVGYEEDSDCLCVKNGNLVDPTKPTYCQDDSCKPAIVLLPIFTVENAPPHKLKLESFSNNRLRKRKSGNFKQEEDYKMNKQILDPQSLHEFSRMLRDPDVTDVRSPQEMRHLLSQPRFLDKPKLIEFNQDHHLNTNPLSNKKYVVKQSIFSRATKFQLPKRKIFNSNPVTVKEIKKNVAPRRDFATVQKLLMAYLNKKRNHVENKCTGSKNEYDFTEPPKIIQKLDHVTAKNILNKNKATLTNTTIHFQGSALNTAKDVKEFEIKDSNDEADKKFMILLDYLEKEVKNVELDPKDKEIFDAKIRKIYNAVVGNHQDSHIESHFVTSNKKPSKEFNENAAENVFIDAIRSKYDDIKSINENNQFTKRNQNSIRNDIKNYETHDKLVYDFEDNLKESARFRNRNIYATDAKNNNLDIKNDVHHLKTSEDVLSYERRKYYQDKLDNLERKLLSVRSSRRNVHPPRQVRPVLPTSHKEAQIRPSKSKQSDTFYIPDRARFIHGF